MISRDHDIKQMQIQLDNDNELRQPYVDTINHELRCLRRILISIANSLYEIKEKMNEN